MSSREKTDVSGAAETAVDVALGAAAAGLRAASEAVKELAGKCKPAAGKGGEVLQEFERDGRRIRERVREYASAFGAALTDRSGVAREVEVEALRKRVRDLERDIAQIREKAS